MGLFNIIYLNKLKKHHYAIRNNQLIIDYRMHREDLYKKIEPYLTHNEDDYNVCWWTYTNDVINYSDLYCSKNDFENIIKKYIESSL